MALAALNGIRRDGSSMKRPAEGSHEPGHLATLREIATELGWKDTSAARRGIRYLEAENVARRHVHGWELDPKKHAERCSQPAYWLQLNRAARCFNLESSLLGLLAVVSSQQRAHLGHAVIGRRRFAEILGDGNRYEADPDYQKVWNRTTNKRTAKLEGLGILERWNRPGDGLTCYRPSELLGQVEKQLAEPRGERAPEGAGRAQAPRRGERASEGAASEHGERASPTWREGTPDVVRGHPPRGERAPVKRSTLGVHQDHQRTPARADVGGVAPPDVEAESRNKAPEPGGAGERPTLNELRAAGMNERDATELADTIEAARGDKAPAWTAKQLTDIRRDPNVTSPAAVLRARIKRGAHLPENDPPPRPQDHDAGAGIREANTRDAEHRRVADSDYERRRIQAMLTGDGLQPEEVAKRLGTPLSEVLQIAHEARSPQRAPMAPPPGDRPSRGIEGIRELVAARRADRQARTA